jgi:hypothetical protein
MDVKKNIRAAFYKLKRFNKWDYKPEILKPKIVITFTTIPSRISQIKPTIMSLLQQTHRPCVIELNLAKKPQKMDKPWSLPLWLQELNSVSIHWLDHDYGPASKLIPTLERHQEEDCLIVVVDDDMIYPKNLVECFFKADQESNGKKVFCANGHPIVKNHHFFESPSDKRIKTGQRRVAIIEGCGGYSLHPKYFNIRDLKSLSGAPEGAMRMDDIWFSGHLSRRNIEKIQIATKPRHSLPQATIPAIIGPRVELSDTLLDFFSKDWHPDEYSD